MAAQERFSNPTEFSHRIGAHGKFSLINVSGDVRLEGTDGDEVHVIARSSGGRGEWLPLIVRRDEDGLHVEADEKSVEFLGMRVRRGPEGIDFQVQLPRGARVDTSTVSGDVDAQGLNGEQAYKSVSGDIELAGHGGRISLSTVSGDIELAADGPVAATATTTSGDLAVAAPSIEALAVKTVSGDVRVSGPFAAGPLHSVETVSGDLTLAPGSGLTVEVKRGLDVAGAGRRIVVGDGAAQLRFRSLSGDVDLSHAEPAATHDARDAHPVMDAELPHEPQARDELEVLRALERGEIDVEEASRRLEGARVDG